MSIDTTKDILGQILAQVAEHARDHHEACEQLPILPAKPVSASSMAALGLTGSGIGLEATFQELMSTLVPSLPNSVGPRYFSLVTGGVTPAALVADWLTTVYDQNSILATQNVYSGQTQIEHQACEMFVSLLDLPTTQFRAILTTGSTASNIEAVALGRQWLGATKFGIDYSQDGYDGQVVVLTNRAHATVYKAASMLGIGRKQVHEMMGHLEDEGVLESKLQELARQGKAVMVVLGFGEVNTGIFPRPGAVQRIAELCRQHGAFLHIDGAFGAFARCSPSYAELADGLELADSITVCGHKWLNVPYDCGFFIVRRDLERDLERVFSSSAAYLKPVPGVPTHPMNLSIENSQRMRALAVWATLRAYGRAGYQKIVEDNCRFAKTMHHWMKVERPDLWTVLEEECPLNIVVFQATSPPNKPAAEEEKELEAEARRQEAVVKALNDTGVAAFSGTVWKSRPAIRAAISNWRTNIGKDWEIVRKVLETVGEQFKF
ncbi:hypothetical protein DFQ27_008985 [Actinomortierella ambigua]|uniref:PLP-dependent transferase n=1 Tax=Actinomortierella ambigua TaxID=1343610 RepID=A0A9P6UB80_9FUNG|nr:hypothetical protein DFQ27_008985 [Actinomortierella ambigua]